MDFWESLHRHFVPSKQNAYRPHILRRGWLLFFLAVTLSAEGFLVGSLLFRQSSGNFLAAVVPGEIIALTNDERTQNNVGTLSENSILDAAAQAKADDMAAKGYFSHVGPDGKQPWDWISDAGYDYEYAGENLAVRFVDSHDVVNAWMASPTHRDNIVKPVYTDIGVGVANGIYQGEPATFVVQFFGAPMAAAPVAPQVAQASVEQAAQGGAAGEVRGASVGPIPTTSPRTISSPTQSSQKEANSISQSLERQFARLLSEPRASATSALLLVAMVLILALSMTFFVHIQIQPTYMLLGGAVVVSLVLTFLIVNGTVLNLGATTTPAAASVCAVDSGACPQ